MSEFRTGTTSKITFAAACALLIRAIKNEGVETEGLKRGTEVAEIVPIFKHDGDEIEGFEIVHAAAKPRAERKDKGVPRRRGGDASSTPPPAAQNQAEQAQSAPVTGKTESKGKGEKKPQSPFGDAKEKA